LSRILELNGYSVWFDYGLFSGADFGPQIEREIRAAKAVVVLWCSLSRDSRWVLEEADLAMRLGTLTPAWLERVDPPLGFTRADTIDLTTWDGTPRSHGLDRLLNEIARRVGRDPTPSFRGLQQYEETWRSFGAPPLSRFALTAPVAAREQERLHGKSDDARKPDREERELLEAQERAERERTAREKEKHDRQAREAQERRKAVEQGSGQRERAASLVPPRKAIDVMTLITGLVGIVMVATFLGIMLWWVQAPPLIIIVVFVLSLMVYDFLQEVRTASRS
jgi:hypothetical protein